MKHFSVIIEAEAVYYAQDQNLKYYNAMQLINCKVISKKCIYNLKFIKKKFFENFQQVLTSIYNIFLFVKKHFL